jgi:tRNA U34 2-thiouridine synthase MnmA/TrmU
MRHCEKRHIKNQTRKISSEKLNFKEGIALGDVDIFIDGGKTRNKVRRIVEKRVIQDYWRTVGRHEGNMDRYKTRRRVSCSLKNIYGAVPCGFSFAS